MKIGLFELLCIRTQRNLWMPSSSVMTQQTSLDQKNKKKSKMVDRVASENQTVSNLYLLEVLERVEKMQVQYLTRRAGLTIGHIPGGK